MFLLNADQIRAAVDGDFGTRLDIAPFEIGCLQHTSYTFRLGKEIRRFEYRDGSGDAFSEVIDELSEGEFLTLRPREYVLVKSLERFHLAKSTLGVFGGISDIARRGMQLIHSPFIDPLFPGEKSMGVLELGLMNLTNFNASIRYGQKIGKVSFFDVSDTYPVTLIPGSDAQGKFDRRSQAG